MKEKKQNSWFQFMMQTNRKWFILALFATVVNMYVTVLSANKMKELTNSAMNGNINQLTSIILIIILLLIIVIPFSMLKTYSSKRYSEGCIYTIRKKTMESLCHLEYVEIEKLRKGDVLSRYTNDIGSIQDFIDNYFLNLFFLPIEFLIAFVYLLRLNIAVTLAVTIPIPFLMFLVGKVTGKARTIVLQTQQAYGEVNCITQDAVNGIITLKAFSLEKIVDQKLDQAVGRVVEKQMKIAVLRGVMIPITNALELLPFIVTLSFGGYFVIKGYMTFGSVYAFLVLLNKFTASISRFPDAVTGLKFGQASFDRMFELWNLPKEETKHSEVQRINNEVAIEFDHVNFSYDGEHNVLKDICLSIHSGEKVAIVGSSGCGKSTLIKLLLGLYLPDSGEINIFGNKIKNVNREDIRKFTSYVSQDVFLLSESIGDNITGCDPKIAKDQIITAAKLADAHEFITDLDGGYDADAGENAVRISGGQKQRIAIARAILRDTPILILDEATSALDNQTEQKICTMIRETMQEKTVISVTHRLSSLSFVDRVIVIKDGIAEEVPYEEIWNQ